MGKRDREMGGGEKGLTLRKTMKDDDVFVARRGR